MNKNKKLCSYCSVPSVMYKCLLCNFTGKIGIPKNIKFGSGDKNDFTVINTDYVTCDQCDGRGWVLMPPFIADMFPSNVIKNIDEF